MIFHEYAKGQCWLLTKRLLLNMKLAVFITLVTVFQAAAGGFAQTITLKAKNMSLVEVMRSVQKQSGHPFFLTGKDLANLKVNVSIQNLSLDEAMDELLKGKSVDWALQNETIIVKHVAQAMPREVGTSFDLNVIQDKTIQGRVVDETGDPLQGVTVRVKGTTTATITDEQGNYHLVIPANENVLVFTIVGFDATEKEIGSQNTVDVTLTKAISDLDAVIVIGYGTAK